MSTQAKAHTNNVHLIGNLGKDVQLTTYESGKVKASFSLATNENYKNQKGEFVTNTTWHNIVLWGSKAEKLEGLTKGIRVEVKGSLSNRSYDNKEGQKRYITEILASQVTKLENVENEVPMPSPL